MPDLSICDFGALLQEYDLFRAIPDVAAVDQFYQQRVLQTINWDFTGLEVKPCPNRFGENRLMQNRVAVQDCKKVQRRVGSPHHITIQVDDGRFTGLLERDLQAVKPGQRSNFEGNVAAQAAALRMVAMNVETKFIPVQ